MPSKFLVCLSLLAAFAPAQSLPTGVVKKASLGGITEYQYPNGLRVLLYPNPANPKVTINVTYLVGSRHEGYGETGELHRSHWTRHGEPLVITIVDSADAVAALAAAVEPMMDTGLMALSNVQVVRKSSGVAGVRSFP